MKPLQPIEIVGGGLAGLSLGLALRRGGAPVTLFEAGDYPRHRVCGEFITGLSAETASELGLDPLLHDSLRHREVAWFIHESLARLQRLPRPAIGISRYALDARLARAFVEAGGDLRARTRVTSLDAQPGRVFATGRKRGAARWIGLKVHARDLPLARDLELHLGDHAYVGLSRVEDGAVNICGLFRRRTAQGRGADLLIAYLGAANLPALAGRLAAACLDRDSFCAVAALNFDRRVLQSDRVCLGDACAMIPPFTGNGMAMAFQSAQLAFAPLLAYARGAIAWTESCRRIHGALRREFRLRLASADALHPFLLRPRRQRWLAAMTRAQLLPFSSLYATLH